jgi:hypothetical protein
MGTRTRIKNRTTPIVCQELITKWQAEEVKAKAKLEKAKSIQADAKKTEALFRLVLKEIKENVIEEFSPLPSGNGYYLNRNVRQLHMFCNDISTSVGMTLRRADIGLVMQEIGAVKHGLAGYILPTLPIKSRVPTVANKPAKQLSAKVVEPVKIEKFYTRGSKTGISRILLLPSMYLITVSETSIKDAQIHLGPHLSTTTIHDPLYPKTSYEYDDFYLITNKDGLIVRIKEV